MTLSVAQSITLLIIALLAIAILLKILIIVHKQTNRVKELEMRMKAMEKMEVDESAVNNDDNDTTDETEKN